MTICIYKNILITFFHSSLLVIEETWHHLEKYAEKGLRTLALCERKLTKEEYKTWAAKYQEAITAIENREKKMEEAQELIEKDLILIGATAIEDRLQDDVARTIAILKEAGIKVWVLTGDKIETAINIAYSCSLLTNELDQVIIDSKEESDIIKKIEDTIRNVKFIYSKSEVHINYI